MERAMNTDIIVIISSFLTFIKLLFSFNVYFQCLCCRFVFYMFRNCVQNWVAEKIKARFYHMARSGVVPAVSVGPQLTRRDVAMLFLERYEQQEGKCGTISQNINSLAAKSTH